MHEKWCRKRDELHAAQYRRNPVEQHPVVIGDTMGELMLLYGIADLAFVGGSLVERGGHNPLEPAAHAIPVLMGPHTFNFKDICAKLQQDDGLITVTDVSSLVTRSPICSPMKTIDCGTAVTRWKCCIKTRVRSRVCYIYCNPICRAGATNVDPTVRRDDRQNAADLLADCLASVDWADEIVLLDSGSSDNTVELARSLGATVYINSDWQGYGIQRQRAGLRDRRLCADD